jgi:hypothetical protein
MCRVIKKSVKILFLFLFLIEVKLYAQNSPLTFSEIMFYPSEQNGEFVEIFNSSETETIDLTGYKFKYYTSSPNNIVALTGGTKLLPGGLAVILQGAYDFNNGIYKNIIPAGTIILRTSGNNFGSSGMADKTSRRVYFISPSSDTVDSYVYSANNNAGYSDEKILMTKDNAVYNWGNAEKLNGTPGLKNSVSPLNYDVSISFLQFTPTAPQSGDSISIKAVAKNVGLKSASNIIANIYCDVNGDSLGVPDEIIYSANQINIDSCDSIFVGKNFYADTAGTYLFIAEILFAEDEKISNNKSYKKIEVTEKPAAPQEIIINEFMYDPPPDEPEWIEIYNRSDRALNLKNWKLGDNTSLITFINIDEIINPGEYVVISDDASITDFYTINSKLIVRSLPGLNNSGDEIRIKNANGVTIDSIKYLPAWGGDGKSLERISTEKPSVNQSNWNSCINAFNGTPGEENSVSQKDNDVSIKIISVDPAVPFVNAIVKLKMLVKNIGRRPAQNISVDLFNDANYDSTTQSNEKIFSKNVLSLEAGDSLIVEHNLIIDSPRKYFLIAAVNYVNDENIFNNIDNFRFTSVESPAGHGDVLINEFMSAPQSGEPEWIEIINNCGRTLNLKNWKLGNKSSSSTLCDEDLFLQPGEYFVISDGPEIRNFYSIPSGLLVKAFPSLNNTSDKIIIKNNYGDIIDEVEYQSAWGKAGKSLERVSITSITQSAENWKVSAGKFNATPGRVNSVSFKKYDLSVKIISDSENYVELGKPIKIKIQLENTGNAKAEECVLKIINDLNNDSILEPTELIKEEILNALTPASTFESVYDFENPTPGINNIYAVIEFNKDEYRDNDTASIKINVVKINERRGDVVVNEIMYAPVSSAPEWIELFNKSDKSINLLGYKIYVGAHAGSALTKVQVLNPNQYFVFTRDSSFLKIYPDVKDAAVINFSALNNSGDRIMIVDSLNRVIDSLEYKSSWGGINGKSIEKIEPELQSTDSLNWKSSKMIGGSPGKINSVSKKNYDVACSKIYFNPARPFAGDNISIHTELLNVGRNEISFYLVLFEVLSNSIKNKIEQSPLMKLLPGEKIIYDFAYIIKSIDTPHDFEVEIAADNDEDLFNNKISASIKPGYNKNSIVINEIMFSPLNGEPEWVEFYNTSNYKINLSGWYISDVLTTPQEVKIKNGFIEPKSFYVITKDSSLLNYHKTIPSGFAVMNFANLNNDADGVVVKDSYGSQIDSVMYDKSWGGQSGKSIERIDVNGNSCNKNNWALSKDIELSTPGRINSVSPKEYDLCVKSFYSVNNFVEEGKPFVLSLKIKNEGSLNAEMIDAKIFLDSNKDSLTSNDELLDTKRINKLVPGEEVIVDFAIHGLSAGQKYFKAEIEFINDQYNENNFMICAINCVRINEERNDLVINEIMYAPAAPEPEWIEIFNRCEKEIDINKYRLNAGSTFKEVTTNSHKLSKGQYFVFASDSSIFDAYPDLKNVIVVKFPALNNSGGKIVLSDSLGRIIDSLEYKSNWGGKNGKSLERIDAFQSSIDSTNWRTCALQSGGTPGKINSVAKKEYDAAVNKIIFTPDKPVAGENVFISAEIENKGTKDIFTEIILNEIENENKVPRERSTIINLKPGEVLIHNFIYKIESLVAKRNFEVEILLQQDEDFVNNKYASFITPAYKPGTITLNEIMFSPLNGEPEWIEISNSFDYNIDISGWTISDVLTKPQATKIKYGTIKKKSLLVISKDSSIVNYHKEIPSGFIVNEFANLNNDADGIVIKDIYGGTIDSLLYDKNWGGENGKSIEKIILNENPCNKNNWASSKDIELSTPGRINSVTKKDYDLVLKTIKTIPAFPAFDDDVEIAAMVFNAGIYPAENFTVEFNFVNGADTILFDKVKAGNLNANDSIEIHANSKIKIEEQKNIFIEIKFEGDQEKSNNILVFSLKPGCKRNDIVISEIMFNPLDGESEWVEIFNNSNNPINLAGWNISDIANPVKAVITNENVELDKYEFAVITPDTNKFPYYPPKKFFQAKFGALGNSTDGIIIRDNRGMVIDSVEYNSNWCGGKGFSIERINNNKSGCDSSNWSSSLNNNGATPGLKNSAAETREYNFNSIIINEILYEPATYNSEFVEFYNASGDSIQIGGMTFQMGSKKIKLTSTFHNIPAENYFVLAADSSIVKNYSYLSACENLVMINNSLSLPNNGTSLILRDAKNNILDSLYYSPLWHNKNIPSVKNKSLERLNPAIAANEKMNWSTSVCGEGATPAKQNSVYVKNIPGESKVTICPNPFSPDNDGFEDFAAINFNFSKKLVQVRIRIFDSVGRLVRTLTHNMPSASKASIIFNGLDENGRALRIGIYILLIEIAADDGSSELMKMPIVIARKL